MEEELKETMKVILGMAKEFMPKYAEMVKLYVEELQKQGFSRDEAISLARGYSVGK